MDPSLNPPKALSSSAKVASGILLSRLAGLARERFFAHYFGNSEAAGAFKAALRIPNFLQNLFGEGILSASFIPVYSRLIGEGQTQLAGQVAGVVGSFLALVVSLLVLLGVVLTPFFVDLVAPGFHGDLRGLTIQIVRILFPGVGVLVLSAWCLGILNSHRRFFISYVAPVLWNVAMIATLVLFGKKQDQFTLVLSLAWGSVVGTLLQFGVQLPFIFLDKSSEGIPIGREIKFALNRSLSPVREVFRNLGPVVLSRGVVQLSAYIDGMIASFLGASAVSGLGYAQTIYLLPIGLFGMSVAAAELPDMSRSLGTPEEIYAQLRKRLISGQRKIAFYVIPSVIGFLILGQYIVAALFQQGKFGAPDTLYVWYILMGSTVGLLAATWGRLYSSCFYALKDTRTPMRFAFIRVILTATLGVLFAFPLRGYLNLAVLNILRLPEPELPGIEMGLGALGLTLSAGLSGWIEFLLLRKSLQSRIGDARVPGRFSAELWFSAVLAALGSVLLKNNLPFLFHHPWMTCAEVLAIFGVIYGALTLMFKIPEAQNLWRAINRFGLRSN